MDRNCASRSLRATEFTLLLVMVVIHATILVFTAVVLSVVVASKVIRGSIRFVLSNILTASLTTVVGITLIGLRAVVLSINSDLFSRTDVSFHLFLLITAIGGNGRSAFMAVFAVVVVVIIKCSNSAVKFKYLIISVVVVWIACVAVGAILVVPGVVEHSPCSAGLNF